MRTFSSLTAAACVVMLAACGNPAGTGPTDEGTEPSIDLEAEGASLLEADRAWFEAYEASDDPAGAFVDLVTDDAYLLPPDAPIAHGKAEIRAVIDMLEGMPGFDIAWTPTVAVISDGADLGYTIGTYQMGMEGPDGEPMNIKGKYLTIWKKQADGSWMVTADMFNADPPPGPEA